LQNLKKDLLCEVKIPDEAVAHFLACSLFF